MMAAPAESTVTVYNGRERLGSVVRRGRQHHAYGDTGRRLGAFRSRAEALAAIDVAAGLGDHPKILPMLGGKLPPLER